jgi:elongation factor 1 alpha-like protein
MSRHRLYQNYDYQKDLEDFDGEEEEEELSPEDKAQMTAATAEVKSTLGPQASKVTTQQIQESLWHYYYDVDKTIAYLISKFVDPAPKPAAKPKVPKATPQVSDGKNYSECPFPLTPPDRQVSPKQIPGELARPTPGQDLPVRASLPTCPG